MCYVLLNRFIINDITIVKNLHNCQLDKGHAVSTMGHNLVLEEKQATRKKSKKSKQPGEAIIPDMFIEISTIEEKQATRKVNKSWV